MPSLLPPTLAGGRLILNRDGCAVTLTHTGRARHAGSHVRSQSVAPGTPRFAGATLHVVLG